MKNRIWYLYNFVLVIILLFFNVTSCKNYQNPKNLEAVENVVESIEENLYRPNFHFTPKANWMNDPNGMFYLNGKYHLYFQYFPDGNIWGPMHWGHAISKDLITWEEQPIALYPDNLGLIFSGSCVVDKNNTSGFGKESKIPIVAIFTYHNMKGEREGDLDFQTQAIAYSLNEGLTWTKYKDNPVIYNDGIKDFRDPKVIWDDSVNKWIMTLAAGNKIMFYSSENLKNWEFESEFGEQIGAHGGVWECPDLFPMNVNGSDETKWVLLVSINPGGPNGGSATQYFVGDFNGKTFVLDNDFSNQLKGQNAVWLDYGRDNYAGVTWSNIPESDGRKLFIGWMSNWDYARDVPTQTWRSTMTIPRELKLKKEKEDYYLESIPVTELYRFAFKSIKKDILSKDEFVNLMADSEINLAKLNAAFEFVNLKEDNYTVLVYNKEGDTLSFGLNNIEQYFFLDRRKSGIVDFSEKFAPSISKVNTGKVISNLKVQFLLDKTSIEVFFNDGKTVLTELFFSKYPLTNLSIVSNDETFKIRNITLQEIN